ncbi:MAG TPA: acyltransferase [Bacteroidia bacterium]|nr:acyltransferase [Bacteroidia bacterium]
MEVVKTRYENLDYLRGLCALSIMAYHYIGWTMRGLDISTALAKLGVYGVSMFYVLSGLTMYLVYFKNFALDKTFFKNFYVKRIFRIYPLMWFVMILAIIMYGTKATPMDLVLQFTGLFGIVDWTSNVPVGIWSIGNELSFYLMLPLFFYCIKKNNILFALISIIVFGMYCYFAFVLFDKTQPVANQDYLYKNPLNQVGLFFGGILVGHFFKEKHFKNVPVLILLGTLLVAFVFYPVDGNAINIIAGAERILYTLICFGVAFCFLKADFNFIPDLLKKPLKWFGDISYSLYLLHPHIWALVTYTSLKIRFVFPIASVATLIVCWLVYKYLESPARNLGVKLVSHTN